MTLRTAVIVGITTAFIVAACGGGQDVTSDTPVVPTLTRSASATSPLQPVTTNTSGGLTLTPTAHTTPPRPTPAATNTVTPRPDTGIPGIDAVVDAVESRDVEALVSLMRPSEVPCRVDPGPLGRDPLCPPDTPDGSLVEAFYISNCKVGRIPFDRAIQNMRRFYGEVFLPASTIYAVYPVLPLSFSGIGVPSYTMLLSYEPVALEEPQGWMLIVEDGGIVGYDSGCVRTPQELIKDHDLTGPVITPPDQG